MNRASDMKSGAKFNSLTAVKFVEKTKKSHTIWEFKCDCGKTIITRVSSVMYGDTTSCGCLRIAIKTKHGLYRSSEYASWHGMKQRCFNINDKGYKDYGGRGVVVCDTWKHSFETFYADMGPKPSPDHSIERKDNDKGYSPDNCHWATKAEQAANRRSNHTYLYKGDPRLIKYIIEKIGVSTVFFRKWLREGLTPDEIDVYITTIRSKFNINRWVYTTVIPFVFKTAEFNGDFSKLIPHGDYIVVSATTMVNNQVMYKLVLRGKPKEYAHLLQQ